MSREKSGSGLGILIILIGIGILLVNFNVLSIDMFWGISHLWPLIFIVIGLSILFKSIRYMGTILWLLFLGVVVAYSFVNMDQKGSADQATYEQAYDHQVDSKLSMDLKTGLLKVDAGPSDKVIYKVPKDYTSPVEVESTEEAFNITIKEKSKDAFFYMKNKAYDVSLPSKSSWYMDVNAGVGEVELKLEDLRVTGMTLDAGIGNCKIYLGEDVQGEYKVDMGIGNITFYIPETVGVKVYYDLGIGKASMPDNYSKGKGTYTSDNYETADKTIIIRVDSGIGNFKIK